MKLKYAVVVLLIGLSLIQLQAKANPETFLSKKIGPEAFLSKQIGYYKLTSKEGDEPPNPMVDGSWRELGNIIYDADEPDASKRYKWWITRQTKPRGIFYTYSADGYSWSLPTLQLSGKEDPYVVIHENKFYLFCEVQAPHNKILRYESNDRGETWSNGNTVLDKSGVGFDADHVASPAVYISNGVWFLFYEGINASGGEIGFAWSIDGFWFQRHPDNPVLTRVADTWESDLVVSSDIFYDEDTGYYYLEYGGRDDSVWRTGFAYSTDLIEWTRYSKNPLIFPEFPTGPEDCVDNNMVFYDVPSQVYVCMYCDSGSPEGIYRGYKRNDVRYIRKLGE